MGRMRVDLDSRALLLGAPAFLALAVAVLLGGDALTRRVRVFRTFCIPRPVTGGLLFACLAWALSQFTPFGIRFDPALRSDLWPAIFAAHPPPAPLELDQPFLIAFFTCVGLSCSVAAVRAGGRAVLALLAAASLLALAQAVLGIGLAGAWGHHPGLGLACGPVSMTGGHGTTAGFANLLESTGLSDARPIGFAAATFGLIIGGIVAGPLGSRLVRRGGLSPITEDAPATAFARDDGGFLRDLVAIYTHRRQALGLSAVLLLCFKAGAWLSYGLSEIGLVFPVYMGSMIVGAGLRNAADQIGLPDLDDLLQALRSVCIGLFLVLALMNTSFAALSGLAPIIVSILLAQVLLALAFTGGLTFRWVGRDYAAAMVAAGHCGFALGATPNALAAMDAIARHHGSAFRPYLAVSLAGGFFLDFINALIIIAAVNWIAA